MINNIINIKRRYTIITKFFHSLIRLWPEGLCTLLYNKHLTDIKANFFPL